MKQKSLYFFSYQINKFYSYQSSHYAFLGVTDDRAKRNLASREAIAKHQISGRTYATIRASIQTYLMFIRLACG